MTRELLTEELLDRLISSPDIQSYLNQDSTNNQTLTTFLESLREANNMKRSELWCKQRRDAIIIWCIEHSFDLTATDNELQRLGERPLLQSK